MSKIIGKYEFEDVTKEFDAPHNYGWLYLIPNIEFRHKYWYMWEFEFYFWKWNKRLQITRTDWDKHPERDEKLFWKKLKKAFKNGKAKT
jgi:hypothetical protein